MPSVSRAQRHVAAVAKKIKDGTMRLADVPIGMRDDVKSMGSMTEKQLADFAGTKEKGLPQHVKKRAKKKRA